MTRFQIIPSPERNPDAHEILSPPPRRVWQLKAGAALLMASAVIGLVLAALFLGSIIAALLVIVVVIVSIVVVIVSMVVAIKAVIRHGARVGEKRRRCVTRDC